MIGPISFCEVQGYTFAAYKAMADLATRLGTSEDGAAWEAKAERLRCAVEAKFWVERLETYAGPALSQSSHSFVTIRTLP